MFSLSGLISYTEYLFLLTILTSKYTASLYNSYVEFSFLTSRTWNLMFLCLSLKALGIELVRCLRELECLLYKHDNLSSDPSIQKKQAWESAPVVQYWGWGSLATQSSRIAEKAPDSESHKVESNNPSSPHQPLASIGTCTGGLTRTRTHTNLNLSICKIMLT